METDKDEEEEAELAAEVVPDILGILWDDESLPDLDAFIPFILDKDSQEEVRQEAKMKQQQEKSLEHEAEDEMQIDEKPLRR